MNPRELLVFQHDSQLGKAPSHVLFESVSVARSVGVDVPRSILEYAIAFDGKPLDEVVKRGESKDLENGVTLIRRI